MRQRLSEKNIFPNFSIEAEYKKLHDLFFDTSEFGRLVGPQKNSRARPSMSYDYCLQSMFLDWKLRGSFTSLEEMLFGLQISESDFEFSCTEERLLDYIQFLLNAIEFVSSEVGKGYYPIYQASDSIYKGIVENSKLLLDRFGAEMVNTHDEIVIVYKDIVANAVSIQEPDLSSSIREYLGIDNRGDLVKKGEILCTLAKKLEPEEGKLKGTEFNSLCSDTTFLMNKVGARHSLEGKDKTQNTFRNMIESEREIWYDRCFDMFLACMSVLPYLDVKEEIKKIKA